MNNKVYSFLIIFLISLSLKSYSQIALGKGFQCVVSKDHYREDYFTDGVYNFHSDAWGREVNSPLEMKAFISESFENKIPFHKTKDNLYWGTGYYNDRYIYLIIIPESYITISVSAPENNIKFSNYSIWLLQQVRNSRRMSKDYYLTNYRGYTCRQ